MRAILLSALASSVSPSAAARLRARDDLQRKPRRRRSTRLRCRPGPGPRRGRVPRGPYGSRSARSQRTTSHRFAKPNGTGNYYEIQLSVSTTRPATRVPEGSCMAPATRSRRCSWWGVRGLVRPLPIRERRHAPAGVRRVRAARRGVLAPAVRRPHGRRGRFPSLSPETWTTKYDTAWPP